jgi:pimeloyl-[acyl-carrier protein] methyl ester esterase
MRDAAERAPHSRYVDIAGGGHAPFLGQADQVALEIRGFMESTDASLVGAT